MLANQSLRRYCSTACRKAAKAELHAAIADGISPFYSLGSIRPRRACEHCHRWFIASTRTQEFCNLSCADAAQEARNAAA
jgi:hypothetical protein